MTTGLKVAWARYGENGFILKGSMSKTHLRFGGQSGHTRCGARIPERRSDFVVVLGPASGAGPCKRCFGES